MNSTTIQGLQHISKFLEDRDIQSTQKALLKVAALLPDTTTYKERQHMSSNPHIEKPGYGVMYYEIEKKHEKGPDYKGFLVLEMDYKAGEKIKIGAWEKKTSIGHTLYSLREDNYTKKKQAAFQPDKEVHQGYAKVKHTRFDDDVPF